MFTFLRDALFSERMFDRVKTPRCARRVAFTVGGTGTVPRPGVRGEASSLDSWTEARPGRVPPICDAFEGLTVRMIAAPSPAGAENRAVFPKRQGKDGGCSFGG